jgi:hypothetical protein
MTAEERWREVSAIWNRLAVWLARAGAMHAEAQAGDEALSALGDIGQLRRALDRAELAAVRAARHGRKSWSEIATMLGVTRQSAWQRWRDLDGAQAAGAGDPAGAEQAVEPSDQSGAEQAADAVRAAAATEQSEQAELAAGRSGRRGELAARVSDRVRRRHKLITVPRVIGLAPEQAQAVLREHGLVPRWADERQAEHVAAGGVLHVSGQAPEHGARVSPATSVRLWVGNGGGGAGVREPRRPLPEPKQGEELRYESADEAS